MVELCSFVGGLAIIKLAKLPLIYSASRFNLGELEASFGGLSPPKPPPVATGLGYSIHLCKMTMAFRDKSLNQVTLTCCKQAITGSFAQLSSVAKYDLFRVCYQYLPTVKQEQAVLHCKSACSLRKCASNVAS